jgi:hypothetical protein
MWKVRRLWHKFQDITVPNKKKTAYTVKIHLDRQKLYWTKKGHSECLVFTEGKFHEIGARLEYPP